MHKTETYTELLILNTVKDLVLDLLLYDRREDSQLPPGVIEQAIKTGEVTVESIVGAFRAELILGLPKENTLESQHKEKVIGQHGEVLLDRVRAVGPPLPPEGVVFIGTPALPIALYREISAGGITYKYAVDAKLDCWAFKSWPGVLDRASPSEIEALLLLNDKPHLLNELEEVLQRKSSLEKCPTCGCIVPKNTPV